MSSKYDRASYFLASVNRSGKSQEPPKSKSRDKAYQDQKPAGHTYKRVSSGAGRDGLTSKMVAVPYYDKVSPQAAPAPTQQAAAPQPKPEVEPKPKPEIEYSSTIQDAKEKVNAWEQSQATVQSSFIKSPTSSDSNQQYDFSGDTFDSNESPEPNEQAQEAQNKLQNYVTKYSDYKSNV